jgi:peptide/nickel transport system substrate-binding protein
VDASALRRCLKVCCERKGAAMGPHSDLGPLTEAAEKDRARFNRGQFVSRAVAAGLAPAAAGLMPAMAGAASSGATASGGTLRIRAEFDLTSADNAFESTFIDEQIALTVCEGLVSYKPGTWDVVNCLAEVFEPSTDGLRFHFKLKRGIPFHQGFGEVTASDVKYSFERIAGLTTP